MTISSDEFRSSLAQWSSGVTVVTTTDGTHLHGMTVSSFGSVSLVPPLISISLERSARCLEACRRSLVFAVNILAADQQHLSNHFASKDSDRLQGQTYTLGSRGCPLLHGAVVQLECSVFDIHQAGDHDLVIGRVETSNTDKRAPLLYLAGSYGQFEPIEQS